VQLKDYYTILGLLPSASGDEIKKAYRKLAHQYHPDKKSADPYAAAQFSDIKEAYEILSNPEKKDYYLQQRWYAQSIGKKFTQESVIPVTILKQMLDLERRTSTLDLHRMNREGLFNKIVAVLSDDNITILNSFNDFTVNKEIVLVALKAGNILSYHFAVLLTEKLKKIKTEAILDKQFVQFIKKHRQTSYWEKRKIWIILLIVLLICLLIFFGST
jgi:preprotein translocase subunit Sec63